MATTHYAWTNIHYMDKDGNKSVTKTGSKVTASGLNMSDDEFQELVNIKAIRTIEYPEMGNFPGSPIELRKAQLAAAAEGGYFDTQYGRVAVNDATEEEVKEVEKGK